MKSTSFRTASRIAATFCFAICCCNCHAQQNGNDLINTLKPALDLQTVGILNIDLERVSFDDLVSPIAESLGESSIERAQFSEAAAEYASGLKQLQQSGATRLNVLFKLGTLVDADCMFAVECRNHDSAQRVAALLDGELRGFYGLYPEVKTKGSVVYASQSDGGRPNWAENTVDPPKWALTHTEKDLKQLASAIEKAGDAPIRFCFVLTDDQKRALVELNPKAFAAGSIGSAASIENLQSISIAIVPGQQIKVWVTATSPESITAMAGKASRSIIAISNMPALKQNLGKFSQWLATLPEQVTPEGSVAILDLSGEQFSNAIRGINGPVYQMLRKQRYSRTIAKLREVVIAFHNYHDANGNLPPSYSVNEAGKPLLSWRVLILPYLGEHSLFDKFNLDEPWDSDTNQLASEAIPSVFRWDWQSADDGQPLTTRIQALKGEGSAISNEPRKLSEIPDGTSSTIAVMEVASAKAVQWSKPVDFDSQQKDLIAGLVDEGSNGFWTGFCDASIHFIPKDMDPAKLRLVMLANDGERVDLHQPPENDNVVDPDYDPLSELPSFWFNHLVPRMWMVGGIE